MPYREFWSRSGLRIWVGKKAKDNDTLTFKLAHGSDFWLHVHGYPGSHVIIKINKGKDPDADTIQDALQLALYYSQAKSQGSSRCINYAKEVCFSVRKRVLKLWKSANF